MNAQEGPSGKRPKIGLALSGGGAKGLAYIGLLRVIDSLGIKIDYISGTSAGGIFGGLYAMGYSADSLKKIAMNINWHRVLSNTVPLNKINIEEKDEYNNYFIEFPIVNGKPTLPSALIEGQYMSEVLNMLTYPARKINDFDKLPIPVVITSSDIVNGGLVLQRKGYLPMAIRATLAIPAVFSPVYIDGKLLVDGGLDRNFPVQEVKDMGADFIIGGYTGFRLFTEKEIANPMKLIYQTHAFKSVEDSKKQMAMTNLLVDFTKALVDFTTADFFEYKKIIAIGEKEARKYLPELIKIAEDQRKYPAEHIQLVKSPEDPIKHIRYQNDRGEDIKNPIIEHFAESYLKLDTGKVYNVNAISDGITNLFGTRFFDKVYYTFEDKGQGETLNIRLKEGKAGTFKAALHYDTEQSAGILVNYTYRNIFLRKSRLLATVDLAERVKVRADYYKFINNDNNLWLKGTFTYLNLQSNDILYRYANDNNYLDNTLKVDLSLGYRLNRSSAFLLTLSRETEAVKRGKNVLEQFLDVSMNRTVYKQTNEAITFAFNQNNQNEAYFSKRGNLLNVQMKYFFDNKLTTKLPESNDEAGQAIYNYLNPTPDQIPGNVLRFFLNETFIQPINRRISVRTNVFWGFNLTGKNKKETSETYVYLNNRFQVGGTDDRQNPAQPGFIGLRKGELAGVNISAFNLSVQYNFIDKLYLAPQVSIVSNNANANPFQGISSDQLAWGYGVKIGYLSIIGPINFSLGKTSNIFERDPLRAYLSIGHKF
ncbi:patatin-like phospholipase family protein [Pedobacter sp. PAMC26386]|nr:patatin-like phospholipase family protein [Pedobacter sp. PAMC26386]